MHSFEVHSNESACGKSGILGLEQVPRTIMTVKSLNFEKHRKVIFGAYIEDHEYYNPTNTKTKQTLTGICLVPTTNFQGGYKILCLRTGKRITCNNFMELPMPQSAIKKATYMVFHEK